VQSVSQWPNLRHLSESEGLLGRRTLDASRSDITAVFKAMITTVMMVSGDTGLLSAGDASKTLVVMRSCSSSSGSPVSQHLPTTDSLPSLHQHPSTSFSSQHLNHSTGVTSHYEHLPCLAADWLPSDADDVTWATVTESGAYLSLPQSGTPLYYYYYYYY